MDKKQTNKTLNLLGKEVEEKMLKASLQDVLMKRGLTASIIIEDELELKKRMEEMGDRLNDYSDYANIYKYAFF